MAMQHLQFKIVLRVFFFFSSHVFFAVVLFDLASVQIIFISQSVMYCFYISKVCMFSVLNHGIYLKWPGLKKL